MIEDKTITITIPFNRINESAEKGNKEGNKELNTTQVKILAEIRKCSTNPLTILKIFITNNNTKIPLNKAKTNIKGVT